MLWRGLDKVSDLCCTLKGESGKWGYKEGAQVSGLVP